MITLSLPWQHIAYQGSLGDLLLCNWRYLHQKLYMTLKRFQWTVYNELEVQKLKQFFCQHELKLKLKSWNWKLKILDWVFWFVFPLTFFPDSWNFLLIYCPLLLSLLKDFDTFFFPCWRFPSPVFSYYVFLVLF